MKKLVNRGSLAISCLMVILLSPHAYAVQDKSIQVTEETVETSGDSQSKYSSFSPSLGARKSFEENVSKSITYKNLMIDDAREDPLAEVQQKDELIQTNKVSVLNSLGGSSHSRIYSADQLPNKFGGDIVKEGLIEVPEGQNAVITGTNTVMIGDNTKKNSTEIVKPKNSTAEESSKPQNKSSRVLVA